MKIYQGTLISYSINELSEEAKGHAYNKWLEYAEYFHHMEARGTLNQFCQIFDVVLENWSVDTCNYSYRCSINNYDIEGISGIRLTTYIWNNYAKYITKGKYYSNNKVVDGKYISKSRYSKILVSFDSCLLSGWCFDYDILKPVIECLEYKRIFNSFEGLVKSCLDNFFKAYSSDMEYNTSMECFFEHAGGNEYDIYGNDIQLAIRLGEFSTVKNKINGGNT